MITYVISITAVHGRTEDASFPSSYEDDGIGPESVEKLGRTFNDVQHIGANWGLSKTNETIYRCVRSSQNALSPDEITNLKEFFSDREKTARIYRLHEL